MAQESVAQDTHFSEQHTGEMHSGNTKGMLGPLLCWAVVFADIGTSIYYTPGILYQTVQGLAAFFVFLTMFVFVLLTLKYVEVTHRFPQGGGVVTVAAQAINPWFGALGGMFILVDYFLTAAISSLSGIQYLSVVFPTIGPPALWITLGVLALLGLLNWVGISESAKVSLVGAIIAFVSDIAILITVFSHISIGDFFALISGMFTGQQITTFSILTGFAGAFLAFSGLESISQLSPVMRKPHKKVAGIAMLLVVLTIGLTSPLLTLFATQLPMLKSAAADPVQSAQIISLLGGVYGGQFLQIEVAISASALLIFASNTAIIGAYHVFMALSRMEFLPDIVLKRNKLRGTPHISIILATGIPILILIAVNGRIDVLGEMYAFGLLGAFTLTCIGLDIVRYRELQRARAFKKGKMKADTLEVVTPATLNEQEPQTTAVHDLMKSTTPPVVSDKPSINGTFGKAKEIREASTLWFKINFGLGILTTVLVAIAWCTNLVVKHDATLFGGGVTVVGMAIAYIYHTRQQKEGKVPVPVVATSLANVPANATIAILTAGNTRNNAVIRAAINNAEHGRPVVFFYITNKKPRRTPQMMEIIDPYLEDQEAKETFSKAEAMALKAKIPNRKYIYLQKRPDVVSQIWQIIHPRDTLIAAENDEHYQNVNPDRIRYEVTPDGRVAHLLKRW